MSTRPHPPRKPSSSFFLFLQENKEKLHQMYPEMSPSEITRQVSEQFQQITPEQRQIFDERAAQLKTEYDVLKAQYTQQWGSPPPLQDSDLPDSFPSPRAPSTKTLPSELPHQPLQALPPSVPLEQEKFSILQEDISPEIKSADEMIGSTTEGQLDKLDQTIDPKLAQTVEERF
jgi:hypothetical protein